MKDQIEHSVVLFSVHLRSASFGSLEKKISLTTNIVII